MKLHAAPGNSRTCAGLCQRALLVRLGAVAVLASLTLLLAMDSGRAAAPSAARLALISDAAEAAAPLDLLTAELSKRPDIQLLERAEIEKAYHEQSLAAGNREPLKLGRVLGADGVLVLGISYSPGTNLTARLIAVKPGVVLRDERFAWPLQNLDEWSASVVRHVGALIPKLAVTARDAVGISIVNFRSAIESPEARQTEQQMKVLTVERLSRERALFVLERQKMRTLAEEKALSADESTFWDGSYLLEGTVDQGGYDPQTVTLNARMTPPRGGTPLQFEVSGSRSNLAEIVSRLTEKISGALQIHSTTPEWNSAAEAAEYFAEAQWAMRWQLYEEAQMAAESAWALGKKDLACALVRVRAYVAEVPSVLPPGSWRYMPGKKLDFVHANDLPNPKYSESALYALNAYEAFSRTSPDGVPKILWGGHGNNDWHNSDWCQLGVDALTAASYVLQHYNLQAEAQKPLADRLADLRAAARSVARLISEAPSVHDSYFVGDRIANHDVLTYTIDEHPNIFRCQVNWGCFWQERPEDTITLYRQLMTSSVFCYVHQDFWQRDPLRPRLVAWTDESRKQIPAIWEAFVRELNASTNVLLQMEAQGLARADAKTPEQTKAAEAQWWDLVRSHRAELVGNNVELFYLGWRFAYNPETQAMDQEYWMKTLPLVKTRAAFARQKQYLTGFTPYNFTTFMEVFSERNYTTNQAAELLPLVEAYKSNLLAQASGPQAFRARGDAHWLDAFLCAQLKLILNPPPVTVANAQMPPTTNVASPLPAPNPPPRRRQPESAVETNVLEVHRYIPMPFDRLPNEGKDQYLPPPRVFALRWSEGKLLADIGYERHAYTFDAAGNWKSTRNAAFSALMLFKPETETWDILLRPDESSPVDATITKMQPNPNRAVLLNGKVYCCHEGRIEVFEPGERKWRVLPIPEQNAEQLFGVHNRLYAVGPNIVYEVSPENSVRILASTRRRPAVSVLDNADRFEAPMLFVAPDDSLCASIGNKLYRLAGNDWEAVPTVTYSQPPEVFPDAIIFRFIASPMSTAASSFWLWRKDSSEPELCLWEAPKNPGMALRRFNFGPAATNQQSEPPAKPTWESSPTQPLAAAAAALFGTNLYLLVDHVEITNNAGRPVAVAKDGYHAQLICLSRDCPEPIGVPLKFDDSKGPLPLKSQGRQLEPWLAYNSAALDTSLQFTGDALFLAQRNTPGIWSVPVSEIDRFLALRKASGRSAREHRMAADAQAAQQLLTKYDRNHNGVIDQDEREEALDDPVFIESELDRIDANHNDCLDPQELAWFDANQNKILDPKEQAGIDITQRLLAQRLVKKFDRNEDGLLDHQEFQFLCRFLASPEGPFVAPTAFQIYDTNHDGFLDPAELEPFMQRATRTRLGARHPHMRPIEEPDPRAAFKNELEAFWRSPQRAR